MQILQTLVELIRHQWLQIWIPDYGWLTSSFESPNRKMGHQLKEYLGNFHDDSLSNIFFSANKLGNFSEEIFIKSILLGNPPERN